MAKASSKETSLTHPVLGSLGSSCPTLFMVNPTLLCASWAIGISLQHGGTFLLEEPIYCASLCLPECLASCTVGVTSKLIKPKRLSPFV
jgi:hypothetical protein